MSLLSELDPDVAYPATPQISGPGRQPGYLGRVSWFCDDSSATLGRRARR